MLDVKILDDKSYSELMSEAMLSLRRLAPDWTDHNAHDPGITFLEMLTWLTEMQRYYIQQITDRHTLQYLKLLGVRPELARPARALVLVDTGGADTVLKKGARADIGGIIYTLPEDTLFHAAEISVCRLPEEQGVSPDGFLPFGEMPRKGDSFCIRLSEPLSPGKTYRLYAGLSPREGMTEMEDGYLTEAEFKAEMFSGMRWLECKISDGTYGFSQSGFITIQVPRFLPRSGRSLIRFTLTRCDMEAEPVFSRLSFRAAVFIQREELCPEDICLPVETDGTVPLPVNGRGVSELVVESVENGQRHEWRRTDNLYCSGPHDFHFELSEDDSHIRFGDGFSGRQAPESVIIRSLYGTMGASGRVKEKLRFFVTDEEHRYPARNPHHAVGGYDRQTIRDALAVFEQERETPRRAVSKSDYAAIVKKTPGLCAKSIVVFEKEPGIVCVCVKTHDGKLSEREAHNIRLRLESARLCCTEVMVMPPVYWRARFRIALRLYEWAADRDGQLRGLIEEIYKPFEDMFGLLISPAQWRDLIMKLPFVQNVTELSVEGRDGRVVRSRETMKLPQDTLLQITELVIKR